MFFPHWIENVYKGQVICYWDLCFIDWRKYLSNSSHNASVMTALHGICTQQFIPAGVFKGQCNRNSVSGIVGFLGFVHVKPGISIDTVFILLFI